MQSSSHSMEPNAGLLVKAGRKQRLRTLSSGRKSLEVTGTIQGGQEVISCNFLFPSSMHFLHLGAKMHCVYGYIQNINFKVYFDS